MSMIIYLVRISQQRVKFGLSRDRETVAKRIATYRTLVPDCYAIRLYEVNNHSYIESLLKKRFEALRVPHIKGGTSEVIHVEDGITDQMITEIVDRIVERGDAGFDSPEEVKDQPEPSTTYSYLVPPPREVIVNGNPDGSPLVRIIY